MEVLDIVLLIALVAIVAGVFSAGSKWVRENARKGAAPATAPASLYDRLGGQGAVDAAVDIFYRRVLADAYIKRFFEGVDMARQSAKQKAFLTMVFGGPNSYTGKDMREGHRHLVKMGLDGTHFDHVLAHLRSTLAELGVGEAGITEVINLAETTRNDVLDR
jgi:hemoglobin